MLVDEFQDTNAIQYAWLTRCSLGAANGQRPFVVGRRRSVASIGWRGAERARRTCSISGAIIPGAQLFKLEQNYRSTGTILKAANALIAHNASRLGKNLWTSGARRRARSSCTPPSTSATRRSSSCIASASGSSAAARARIAMLYRSNAQSRVFEEAFLSARIPYRVYGGLRFFERAEIKDALAYLRLIVEPPRRRLLRARGEPADARHRRQEPRDAARTRAGRGHVACGRRRGTARQPRHRARWTRARRPCSAFLALIDGLARETAGLALHEQVDAVLKGTGLIDHYQKDKADRGEARVENLDELVSAARGFTPEASELPPLEAFLAHAALESGEGQANAWEDCVQMMTLHSAKGLEFPVVFLAGLEEGLFPHQRSTVDLEGLEEERRLALRRHDARHADRCT